MVPPFGTATFSNLQEAGPLGDVTQNSMDQSPQFVDVSPITSDGFTLTYYAN